MEKSERVVATGDELKPMGGSGMKQGRKHMFGAKPRGREKRRGGRKAGAGKRRCESLGICDVAEGSRETHGRTLQPKT